jgi:hypothetical protein
VSRELRIDKAVYLVDDETRTYRFLRRNPDWRSLDPAESLRNQLELDGFTRVLSDRRAVVFRFDEAPSRRAKRRLLESANGADTRG